MTELPPPGWYADTSQGAPEGRERYWAGESWTDQYRLPGEPNSVLSAAPIRATPAPPERPVFTLGTKLENKGLIQVVFAFSAAAVVLGLIINDTSPSFAETSAVASWFARLALPVSAMAIIVGALRKPNRWDCVARGIAGAVALVTLATLLIDNTLGVDSYGRVSTFNKIGPRPLGIDLSLWWLRYALAQALMTGLVSAAGFAAILWANRHEALNGAVAAGVSTAVVTLVFTPINAGVEGSTMAVLTTILWFAAAAIGGVWGPGWLAASSARGLNRVDSNAAKLDDRQVSGARATFSDSQTRVAPTASTAARLAARCIDGALTTVVLVVTIAIGISTGKAGPALAITALAVIATVAWEPLCLASRGATPGKRLLGLRVVRAADDGPITKGPAWGRTLLPVAWLWLPLLGGIVQLIALLSAFGDQGRRTWMDKAAGTRVVKMPRSVDLASAPFGAPPRAPVPPNDGSSDVASTSIGSLPPPVTAPASVAVPLVDQPWPPVPVGAPVEQPSPMSEAVPAIPDEAVSEQTVPKDRPRPVMGTPTPAFTLWFSDGTRASVTRTLIVGREPSVAPGESEADLVTIADPERSVSRSHLRFRVDGGRLLVEDLGSANGSAIIHSDGSQEPLRPGSATDVTTARSILFGAAEARIELG